jgi:uncharacterized protein YxjI
VAVLLRQRRDTSAEPGSYTIRKRLFRLGDDYRIDDAAGAPVLELEQRLFRPWRTFDLRTPRGKRVARVRQRRLRLRETMAVERDGRVVAEVARHRWNPVAERFDVSVTGAAGLGAIGSRVSPDYRIQRGELVVADVAQAVTNVRDTYAVRLGPKEDQELLLAIAVAINELTHARGKGYRWLRAIAWQGAALAMKIALDRSQSRRNGSWASTARTLVSRPSARNAEAQRAAQPPDQHAST